MVPEADSNLREEEKRPLRYLETRRDCDSVQALVDAALHLKSKNIFHRDIKTENMLIETGSNFPRVCLIDFMSCFDEERPTYRDFFGTVASPEVYRRNRYKAEPTTVFQIGAVLYDAIHEEKDVFDTLKFSSQSLPKRLSKECNDFLQRCLRRHPSTRPTLEKLRKHQWHR